MQSNRDLRGAPPQLDDKQSTEFNRMVTSCIAVSDINQCMQSCRNLLRLRQSDLSQGVYSEAIKDGHGHAIDKGDHLVDTAKD